jgi:hypothetical protein
LGIAEVPTGFDVPTGPEAVFAQGFIVKASADRFFRHHNNRLLESLMFQFVEGGDLSNSLDRDDNS